MKTISYEANKNYVDNLKSSFSLEDETDFTLFLEFLKKRLSPKDAVLVFSIIERGESLSDIAKRKGVTRQAISQQMKGLLKKLVKLRKEFNS